MSGPQVAEFHAGEWALYTWIGDALEGARRAEGAAAYVAGDAGVGKSYLLQRLADRALSCGATVIRSRTPAVTSSSRHGCVAVLLAEVAHAFPSVAGDVELWQGPLAGLLPGVAAPTAWPDVVVGEAVRRVLEAAASPARPLLVLVDDLHRADDASLAVVDHLWASLERSAIVAVGALRCPPTSPADDIAESAARDRVATLIRLAPLQPGEVANLLRDRLGEEIDGRTLDAVMSSTGGLPRAVDEMLDAAGHEVGCLREVRMVPRAIDEMTSIRLRSLPVWALPVAQAIALVEGDRRPQLVAAAGDVEPDDVEAALPILDERGLTTVACLRAIFATLPPAIRRTMAMRGIGALTDAGAMTSGADARLAATLARHAGDERLSEKYRALAAQRAIESGELDDVDALAAPHPLGVVARDAAGVYELQLQLLGAAGRVREAVDVGASLLRILGAGGSTAVASAHLALGSVLVASTDAGKAAAHLDIATSLSTEQGDAVLDARRTLLQQQVRMGDIDIATLEALVEQATEPRIVVDALDLIGRRLAPGDPRLAAGAFHRELTAAQRHRLPLAAARARLHLAELSAAATLDLTELARARDVAAARGVVSATVRGDVTLGVLLVLTGCVDQAELRLADAVAEARRHDLADLPVALAWLARTQVMRGMPEVADNLIAEAEALGRGRPDVTAAVLGEVRAFRHLACGDIADARLLLDLAAAAAAERGPVSIWPFDGIRQVLAAAAGPSDEPAAGWTRLARGCAGYARALRHGRDGRTADASKEAECADAYLFPAPWHHHLVRAIAAAPALREGWGAPEEWLRAGNSYFGSVSQPALAAYCRRELAVSGLPVPRRRGTTVVPPALAALRVTGRELEVLALLREGLTRRQVAQRLVLSEDTVKTHVKNLLRKTGAGSQQELVERIANIEPAPAVGVS